MTDGQTPAFSYEGLTKREIMATLICAGMSADPERSASFKTYARESVIQADALIEALNLDQGTLYKRTKED